jgi:manganese/zinc/iron transport system substrate-binding protein
MKTMKKPYRNNRAGKNSIPDKAKTGCWVWLGIFVLLIQACSPQKTRSARLQIVTTTGIIADAVHNIVGSTADVHPLMQPGVDPHLYKATIRDIKLLTNADIVFYGGLHLEGKMQDVLQKAARIQTIVAVTDGIPKEKLIRIGKTTYDPHIWFDVTLWQYCVKQISLTLQKRDPLHARLYEENTQAYLAKLDLLHQYIQTSIASIRPNQRVLITAHDAFSYFGRAYHIQVRGLQGISTLSEFGLRDVTSLVEFISQRRIKALFIETSVSRKAIDAVIEGCQARGHPVRIGGSLYSDALGAPGSPADTYEKMVRSNVQTITKALQ